MEPATIPMAKVHTLSGTRSKLSKIAHDDPKLLKEKILEIIKKEDVAYFKCQFTDLTGIIKSITMPISKVEDAIESNIWFDGSSIEGFTRIFESDMYLKLDLSTFAIIPWSRDRGRVTARFICDVYTPDGQPFDGDPRYILPHDKAGYFDFSTDLAVDIRKEITDALIDLDIDVETLHHEVAEGQHEINFTYSDALTTADNAATLKFTVKAVAQKYGLHATFMPKPIAGQNGSGMHIHQSMFKNGENVFFDENSETKLSTLALQFIAGQLKHIKAMAAILNPIVNSYKRLVPGYEAPTYIAWGNTNRSALIRIPRYTPGREKSTRAELRNPDPSCNPYLAFAVMLAAGLDGIENEMTPPAPVNEDIFTLDDVKAKELQIDSLPHNLWEATKELEKDDVIRETLGEHAFQSIYSANKAQWFDYKTYVTKWEYNKYLSTY
jgi:glutamine synthetase